MLTRVLSAGLAGTDAFEVWVEVDVSPGLPSFQIVGLPDTAVKESRERVKSALQNSGFRFPAKKVVVNLSPADIRKEGALYDLPIALGIVSAVSEGKIKVPEDTVFVGELSLDGSVRKVKGVLAICLWAKGKGLKAVVPEENRAEAEFSGAKAFAVKNIGDALRVIEGKAENLQVEPKKISLDNVEYEVDLSDIKGQEFAKRALEVCAGGGHNMLMIGPPGSGKTLLAKALVSILPPLSEEEALEVSKIYSVAGLLKDGIITARPFRSPHHTASDVALVGGGTIPKPGEVSLAHRGVLFLDELPEFKRQTLEALRIPLEEGKVVISRSARTVTLPARFQLVSAMNPCPCGNFKNPKATCRCTPGQIKKYLSKISGPLLDRFDIQIEVPQLSADEILGKGEGESSEKVRQRVMMAREIQRRRFGRDRTNAEMTPSEIKVFCKLDEKGEEILKRVIEVKKLSARSVSKILKVARTVADLSGQDKILAEHILEAVGYRQADKYFSGEFYL